MPVQICVHSDEAKFVVVVLVQQVEHIKGDFSKVKQIDETFRVDYLLLLGSIKLGPNFFVTYIELKWIVLYPSTILLTIFLNKLQLFKYVLILFFGLLLKVSQVVHLLWVPIDEIEQLHDYVVGAHKFLWKQACTAITFLFALLNWYILITMYAKLS